MTIGLLHYETGINKLENVQAISNALQLEAARATPVLFRFNYDAIPSLKSLNLPIVVLWRFRCSSLESAYGASY